MDWPLTPVERLQEFRPPFCPRDDCPDHRTDRPLGFHRHGIYRNRKGRSVPRFLCRRCRRTFSRQAFSLAYYLKRPELLRPVAAGLQAGSAHRQLARTLGCAPSTVTRLSARLGRHALLLMTVALENLEGRLDEPVVLDHFETFELSQDLPFGVATAVGATSWFIYALDPAPHARTGKRTLYQENRRRRRFPRPRRGGYAGSTDRVLRRLLPLISREQQLHVIGDGHPSYDRAVARQAPTRRIHLERHPNPPRGPKGSPRSARAVARDRALFPVDLLHGLLRHSLAAHRRETLAFGRRLNALMERLFLAALWRNFIKGRSERGDRTTPAMQVGLTDRPWTWQKALSRRLFPARVALAGVWRELYRRDWLTPDLPHNTRFRSRFAA